MIRRVRRQFICITMAMLTAVLMVPLVAINVVTEAMSYNQTKDLLEQIAISETAAPERPDGKPHGADGMQTETTPAETDTSVEETITTTNSSETTTETVTSAAETKTDTAKGAAGGEQTQAPQQTTVQTQRPTAQQTTAAKATTKAAAKTTAAVTKAQTQPAATTAPRVQTSPPQTQMPEDPHHWWEWEDPNQHPDDWQNDDRANYAASVQETPVMAITPLYQINDTLAQSKPLRTGGPDEPPLPDKKDNNSVTIDHFLCYANHEGTLTQLDGTDEYTESDAQVLLDYVLEKDSDDGWYGNLQYFRRDYDMGTLVVFSDRSAEELLLHKVLLVSILVFLFMEGVAFVLTMILTRRAMRPIQETFEQQRQFISDAGHELKTPLTIISANADILHDEIGENKWLNYIRSQADRMRVLSGEMMNLTKLELRSKEEISIEFSLSEAVSSAALPFEGQAFEEEKKLVLEIQEGVSYTGNPDQIKQLVGIFMDNALKYSEEHGEIRVTLQQVQNKKTLKIYNTGKGIPPEEAEKIFERFYRSDASRARATGGYGLGLSIAKSIANAHKIKIQVESEYEHWICFILTF